MKEPADEEVELGVNEKEGGIDEELDYGGIYESFAAPVHVGVFTGSYSAEEHTETESRGEDLQPNGTELPFVLYDGHYERHGDYLHAVTKIDEDEEKVADNLVFAEFYSIVENVVERIELSDLHL